MSLSKTMKIRVKNQLAVIFTTLFFSTPRSAMYFAGAYFISAILLPNIFQKPFEELSLAVTLISFGVLFFIIAKQVINSVLHTKHTTVELTNSNINFEISGFTTEVFSIPLDQISSVRVSQAFTDKFFGVASIVISQIAGNFAVFGFEYEDAKKFAAQYSSKQQTRLKKKQK